MNSEERKAFKRQIYAEYAPVFRDDVFTDGRTVIVGERATGKTTALVKMSAETQIPIYCRDNMQVKLIKHSAKCLGLEIPEPVMGDCHGRKGVLIDEAQTLLQELLGCKVYGLTTTGETVDLNKFEEKTSVNNNGVTIDNNGIIVTDSNNSNEKIVIQKGQIAFTKDNGVSWKTIRFC